MRLKDVCHSFKTVIRFWVIKGNSIFNFLGNKLTQKFLFTNKFMLV